jgi:hypothetical protein
MKQLLQEDLRLVVSRLPKDVVSLMKRETLFVGGGFIRETVAGGKVNDIDFFGPSVADLKRIAEGLGQLRSVKKVCTTKNAITILGMGRLPVQFITRWVYDQPQLVAESFDFAMCQAVVWYDKKGGHWDSLVSERFYEDIAAKRLTYTFPKRDEDAGGSILRVSKFLRRGYNISPENLAGVLSQLMGKVDTDSVIWRDGVKGRASVITGLLREVDPLTVIDGIEMRGDDEDEEEIILPQPVSIQPPPFDDPLY